MLAFIYWYFYFISNLLINKESLNLSVIDGVVIGIKGAF